jgi:REP element-mobilizing transposase RayT
MNHYERRLPHWDVLGQPLFVTFRLHGSLPANRVFPPQRLTNGKAFVAMDRILDRADSGPLFLRQQEIAELVVSALRDGERRFQRYQLHSFVVMANHVHILVTPQVVATKWLGPLKGFTAYQANQLLGRHGAFWQDESYDHLVRSDAEFGRIRAYIERNPVIAGLVADPGQYRWSSAFGGTDGAAADGTDGGAADGTDGGAADGTDGGAADGTDGAAADGTDGGAADGTDGAAADGTDGAAADGADGAA